MSDRQATQRWLGLVPNVLSGVRLGLAITFPLVATVWRVPLVAAAGVSDLADGYLARRLQATTWYGGLLDAGADKAFTVSTLLVLLYEGTLVPWQLGALLARDLAVVGIAGYAAAVGRPSEIKKMSSRLPGKATTAALFVLFVVLFWPTPTAPDWVDTVTFWAAVGASGIAAADYLLSFPGQWWTAQDRG